MIVRSKNWRMGLTGAGFRLRPRHPHNRFPRKLLPAALSRPRWPGQPSCSSTKEFRVGKAPTPCGGQESRLISSTGEIWDERADADLAARTAEGVTKWEANKHVLAFPGYNWGASGMATGGHPTLQEAMAVVGQGRAPPGATALAACDMSWLRLLGGMPWPATP